jgi:hypothetical protein
MSGAFTLLKIKKKQINGAKKNKIISYAPPFRAVAPVSLFLKKKESVEIYSLNYNSTQISIYSNHMAHQDSKKDIDTLSSCSEDVISTQRDVRRPFWDVVSNALFQWQSLALFCILALGFVFNLYLKSDIFTYPQEVASTRRAFFSGLSRYEKNRDYWDAKLAGSIKNIRELVDAGRQEEVIAFLNDSSPEILVSFIVKKLHVGLHHSDHSVLFPKENSTNFTFVFSKYEAEARPLKIMISLEVEISWNGSNFVTEYKRLRRGLQDISIDLARSYFGPELEIMKEFELLVSSKSSL